MSNDGALKRKIKKDRIKRLIPSGQVYSNSIQKQLKLKLIENKKRVLVKKIEAAIIELIYSADELKQAEVPKYLNEKLNYNYNYLSDIFSKIKGTTLKTFIITTKVERVKELLIKDEHSIAEIASILNYKSVSHLSTQFKSVIGITPSYFLASQLQMDNNNQ
jgi:AraC-like DNA-binding protein